MQVSRVQSSPLVYSAKSRVNMGTKSLAAPVKSPSMVHLAFTGGGKNLGQVASLTPENNGLGLPEAAQGGEGVVGKEIAASMRNEVYKTVKKADGTIENVNYDVRSFMPFWNYNNPEGGFKFLIHTKKDFPNGFNAMEHKTMPANKFYSAKPGETLEVVAKKLGLKPSELSYVIQSAPNGSAFDAPSNYCILEPTSVKGSISRMSDTVLGEMREVPYALMKISANNPEYNELKSFPNYFVYTQDLAKAAKPYSYDCWGNGSFDAEIVNSDEMRALVKILNSQMDTEEFGYYNPGNVLAHDRVSNTYANHVINASAAGDSSVDGVKIHIIDHNTGRNYQGTTSDPFQMLRVVADETDVEALRRLPEFEILKKAQMYGIDNLEKLSPREHQIAWSILEPALRGYRDGAGTYNILKTGISSAKQNPDNVSVGTVSYTFDSEMKSAETPDAAKFLSGDFASVETKSVGNGVTPASLKLDKQDANFGRGNNGLTREAVTGYTPFKYDGTNIKEVIAAKDKNAKWFSKLIWEAGEKGPDALKELFFNKGQIDGGHNVLGYISPIKDGEILVFGFGRPDEQKGFPMSTGGYLDFLKREDISADVKKKVKIVLGAGPWNKDASDYKAIVRDLNEIWALDGGAYKHNIMYIDGFTPNRLVGCAHYGIFTSRREMYGITPIECKAAGTPYGSTKTGGPVDYTNAKNGFLTNEAVELRPERYGLTWKNSEAEIDAARIARQNPQVGDIYASMIDQYTNHYDDYVAMSKKNIEEKVDWHENAEYNRGKSANRRYLEDILETDKPLESRNKNPMKRIMGKFGELKESAEEMIGVTAKSRSMKAIFMIVGGLAVASGTYFIWKNSKKLKAANKKLDNVA